MDIKSNTENQTLYIPNSAFTHSGKFHADDVFAAALLTYMNPKITITRGNSIPDGFDGIVFDIGGGEFDHHQTDKKLREDGTPYAAFGLLWDKFGAEILGEEDAKRFEYDIVKPLDICDNTGCRNTLASIISDFNPPWDSDKEQDEAFEEAKTFALTILKNRFEGIQSVKRAEGMVREALEEMKDNILILPRSAPWKTYVADSSAEFVIYPSNRGGYNAQGVPTPEVDDDKNNLKIYFPQNWAGLRDEELEDASGIQGLRFCHSSRFLVAADTIEAALEACKYAKKVSI
ncbi:MAG: MYG1 family protein [Clostridiales bacterium]|nr:MYG1 family protein [Clostridiales bacterium]